MLTRFELLDAITPPLLWILPFVIAEQTSRMHRLRDRWVFVVNALGGLATGLLLNAATLLAWVTLGAARGDFPVGEWARERSVVRQGLVIGVGAGILALVVRNIVRARQERQESRDHTGGTTP